MTISSTVNRNDYIGNGSVNTYSYSFKVFLSSELLVTVRNLSNVETTLSLTTDYTVTGVGDTAGGTIVLVNSSQAWLTSGNLTTNFRLTIRRVRVLTQLTSIRNQKDFFASTHEDVFDKHIMIDQQVQDSLARSLKLKETEAGTAALTEIPVVADRASKVLAFDSLGRPIAQSNVPTSGVTATAYIETLLDDTTAAAARTTLVISAEVSPSAIAVNQNNYAGATVDGSLVLARLTASAPVNITGLTGGVVDKLLVIANFGTNIITLTHDDAASSAANRILIPGGSALPLSQNESATLKYDNTTQRWRVIASPLIGTAQLEDGSVTTPKIADNSVTFAKIQSINASRILGRGSASSGNTEELSTGTGLTISGTSVVADEASKSQMESETAGKVVMADKVKNSPGTAKAWCHFRVSGGSVTIESNYNMSSITDNGVGDFTYNSSITFTNNKMVTVGTARRAAGDSNLLFALKQGETGSTSSRRIVTTNEATLEDPAEVDFAIFGTQS